MYVGSLGLVLFLRDDSKSLRGFAPSISSIFMYLVDIFGRRRLSVGVYLIGVLAVGLGVLIKVDRATPVRIERISLESYFFAVIRLRGDVVIIIFLNLII